MTSTQRPTPQSAGALCSECPFSKEGKPCNPVRMHIPERRPKYLIVGEAPTREEAETGQLMTGHTGALLKDELMEAKLGVWDAAIIYGIACKPGLRTEANIKKAVKACRPYFREQLRQLKRANGGPGVLPVLVMGKIAAMAFTGKEKGASSGRGFIQQLDSWWGNWRGIITWAPGYAFHGNPYEWGAFSIDVQRFGRLLRNQVDISRSLNIVTDVVDLEKFMSRGLDHIGVDIETAAAQGDPPDPEHPGHTMKRTGLNPLTARLKTIAFGHGREGWALAWDAASSATRRFVKFCLANPKLVKVYHNGYWFDLRVLERYGMKSVNVEDTRDMRRALSSTSPLSLNYCASIYNDTTNWKRDEADEDGDEKKLAFTEDMRKLLIYNAQDACETSLIYMAMKAEMEAGG